MRASRRTPALPRVPELSRDESNNTYVAYLLLFWVVRIHLLLADHYTHPRTHTGQLSCLLESEIHHLTTVIEGLCKGNTPTMLCRQWIVDTQEILQVLFSLPFPRRRNLDGVFIHWILEIFCRCLNAVRHRLVYMRLVQQ